MDEVSIIAIAVLASVLIIGLLLKRHTKRTLSDMDGMGEVTKAQDANEVARF